MNTPPVCAYIEYGLGSKEEKTLGSSLFVFGIESNSTCRLALQQGITIGHKYIVFQLGLLVATHTGLLLYTLDTVLYGFKVFQLKFGIDDFLVANGVY